MHSRAAALAHSTSRQLEMLQYASVPTAPTSGRGKGFVALCASFAVPGLGQYLAGRKLRALAWFSASVALSAATTVCVCFPRYLPILLGLVPLALLVQVGVWFDAYIVGRRSAAPMLGRPMFRYLIGIAVLVAACVASPNVLLAQWFRGHVVEAFTMPTESMSPTVQPRDRFLVHKHEPFTRYSVVALIGPDRMKMIKRVVGFPGEKVELRGNQLYLNDKPILLPRGVGPFLSPARGGIGCEGHPITLGAGEYFVLGDNSPVSGDSRYWEMGMDGHQPGALPRDHILGTATWIYWPPKRWRRLDDVPLSAERENQY